MSLRPCGPPLRIYRGSFQRFPRPTGVRPRKNPVRSPDSRRPKAATPKTPSISFSPHTSCLRTSPHGYFSVLYSIRSSDRSKSPVCGKWAITGCATTVSGEGLWIPRSFPHPYKKRSLSARTGIFSRWSGILLKGLTSPGRSDTPPYSGQTAARPGRPPPESCRRRPPPPAGSL